MSDFTLTPPPIGPRQDPAEEWYPTPAWATRALLAEEEIGGRVLEPCCGTGEMLAVLAANGCRVHGLELNVERAAIATELGEVSVGDFLDPMGGAYLATFGPWDAVVTNPPFSLFVEFTRLSFCFVRPGGHIAMLAPVEYIAGVERSALYARGSGFLSYNVLIRRPWAHAKAMAWFVWRRGYTGGWVGRHLDADR